MTATISNAWEDLDFGFDEPTPSLASTVPASFRPPQVLELDAYDEPKPQHQTPPKIYSDLADGETFTLAIEEGRSPARHLSEWSPQLPLALAMDVEDEDAILARFDLSREKYELLKPLPAFRKALAEAQKSLREQGHTFKIKCAGIAEEFLDQLYLELYDPGVGLTTKIDVVKWMTKMGGLEPAPVKEAAGSNAPQVNIQINL